ncbi:phosphopantetheine-binding protein, partial [Actinomadura sp. NPDC000600]|uniref:phosphopantetheine-binding protein n=1 Tax=Actinomadura sp. NPDC000600 TaxID=3154262 RepID=UPI0033943373
TYLEIGPHPTLTPLLPSILDASESVSESVSESAAVSAGVPARLVTTLREDRPEAEAVLTAAAHLFSQGHDVEWSRLAPDAPAAALPTYAFQRRRYWLGLPGEETPEHVPDVPAGTGGADGVLWEAIERGDLDDVAGKLQLAAAERDALGTILPALSAWRRSRTWSYRIGWRPVADTSAGRLHGTWLAVVPAAPAADGPLAAVLNALAAGGATVTRASIPDGATTPGQVRSALAQAIGDGGPPPEGVVSLLAFGAEEAEAATLCLVAALAELGVEAPPWIITAGAVGALPSDPPADPHAARLWGVDAAARLIDLPPSLGSAEEARLRVVLSGATGEDDVALRGSGLFARRLVRAAAGRNDGAPSWRADGTVLVSGADTGTGRHLARWLAGTGPDEVDLLLAVADESGAAAAEALAAEVRALGAAARALVFDPARPDEAAALPAVGAVAHVVGDMEHPAAEAAASTLAGLARDRNLAAVLLCAEPAGDHLPALTERTSGTAFLAAFARARRAEGVPMTFAVAGPWPEPGAPPADPPGRLRPLPPLQAIGLLAEAAVRGEPSVLIADVDWEKTAGDAPPRVLATLLRGTEAEAEQEEDAPDAVASRRRELLDADPAERSRLLRTVVRDAVAEILGYAEPEAVGSDDSVVELGMSSFAALELATRLTAAIGATVRPAAVFDHPTPDGLAEHLSTVLDGEEGLEDDRPPAGPEQVPAERTAVETVN